MDEQKNNLIIPASIVIAGAIVAVAVFYSVGGPKPQTGSPAPTAAIGALSEVTANDFILGDSKAPVTVIEYGDYQCPFCGKFFREVEPTVREQYVAKGKVRWVYRDFAFLGQESNLASEAARCAADQGKFWEMHDYLFAHQSGENKGAFSKDNLKKFAQALGGLDQTKFNACLDSGKYTSAVQAETIGGQKAGVSGTPSNFINGVLSVGALPASQFVQLIEEALTKAGK